MDENRDVTFREKGKGEWRDGGRDGGRERERERERGGGGGVLTGRGVYQDATVRDCKNVGHQEAV